MKFDLGTLFCAVLSLDRPLGKFLPDEGKLYKILEQLISPGFGYEILGCSCCDI